MSPEEISLKFSYPNFLINAFFHVAKFVMIAAGRRTGKTYNAVQWLCDELLGIEGGKGLWIDTKHANIDKYVDRYFRAILRPIWHLCNWNQQKKILKLPNGSYIDFGSAERPELLEGFDYDRGVVNEAGIALKKLGLWENTLAPMFKSMKAKVRFIGTPKSKNKFYELYSMGKGNSPEYKSFQFSIYDSPYWSPEEIEAVKSQTTAEAWKQEYLAEFIEGAGAVFRHIEEAVQSREYDQPKEGKEYVMSVDLAKHQDFTVIMIAEKSSREVIYMDRFNQIDWVFQKKRIYATWLRFKKPRLVIDSTGVGDAIYDDLSQAINNLEPFEFTSASKTPLIQELAVAIENKNIKYFGWEVLMDELGLYEYQYSRVTNRVSYNAPEGFHDDTVIALALVNHILGNEKKLEILFV